MKHNIISKFIIVSAIAAALVGCQSGKDMHEFENKVFISANSFAKQLRVQTDEKVDKLSAEFAVGMADAEASDVEVVFEPVLTEANLNIYRKTYYDESAVLLDSKCFNIPETKAVIAKGSVQSNPLTVNFSNLTQLDYSTVYVLPVSIVSTSGVAVLESARTIFFVIKEASLINVVGDITNNCAWPEWGDFEEVKDMEAFTMECLVNPSAFTNKEIHTIMGIEDMFLVRVGDNLLPKNQIQVATCRIDVENNTSYRASVTNSSMKLSEDQWYHLAVTFNRGLTKVYINGKLKGQNDFSQGNIQMTTANFMVPHSDESDGKPRCFWIGYSYNNERPFLGSISEVRMWNRVLEESEINAPGHFYKINLKDDSAKQGLIAYWKFNDATGNTVKDHSGYGHDLKAASSLVWREVELPVKE